MTHTRRLDVICPVFREREVIGRFHQALVDALSSLEDRYEWVVTYVVDPADDGTQEILLDLSGRDSRVRLIVLSRRFGHQAALIAGLDHAEGEAVVMLDSDLQHPPRLIPDLVAQYEAGADVVQALRQDSSTTSRLRSGASNTFYRLLSRLSSLDMDPGSADFRLLSRRVVSVFQQQLREQNPFVRGLVQWVGFRVALVPFEVEPRQGGVSKYRLATLLEFALTGITSFSKTPIRIAGVLGFAMSALSMLYATFAVAAYFASAYVPPGWTSVLAAVSLVGGIQLFFLGLLSEYVGYVFDEVKARPRYIVDRYAGWPPAAERPGIPPLVAEDPAADPMTKRY